MKKKQPFIKPVKTPTIIQMEAVECGAASLAIILGYHGRFVPLEDLRYECGVSRDGSNLFNMTQAAEKYGIQADVFMWSAESLKTKHPPFIVFWDYIHFLVVEGFKKDRVYLSDPASGRRSVSWEEFQKHYSGITCMCKKMPSFRKGGKPPSFLWEALGKLKDSKKSLFYLALVTFGAMFVGGIYPGFSKVFFDTILGKGVFDWVYFFIVGYVILILFTGFFSWMQTSTLNRLNIKLSMRYSAQYFWHILRLPLSFYQQRYSGEIANRLNLNDEALQALTGTVGSASVSLIFIVLYAVLMFIYSPLITFIGIFATGLNLLSILWLQRSRYDAFVRLQQESGRLIGVAIGGLSFIETVKAGGGESGLFQKWAGYFTKNSNALQELSQKNAYLSTLPTLLNSLTTATLFWLGGRMILKGDFTVGMLMAMQGLLGSFMAPVMQLSGLSETLQTVKVNISRVNDVLKQKIDPIFQGNKELKQFTESPFLKGYLEYRNVSFGYSRLEPPLIEGFNLSLKPGERVALIGPTGCGKSTLGKLFTGLLQPWSGDVLYDGQKRLDLPREVLVQSIASVDQEIFLFSGTIRDNLTLLDPTLSDAEVIEAAKDACIHEEILQKPGGYNYFLNEDGRNLSGGQRQRLEIARALLMKPKILLLDEATSSLDSKMEEQIVRNIRHRGCTCLMIAHRLSTIRDCDEIILLENGQVVQRGNHESLKNEEGLYRELISKES